VVLADTSVWVGHLRDGNPALARLLESGEILMHPMVVGELAMGKLDPRRDILDGLRHLPPAAVATDGEVLAFIETHRLAGTGLGLVDAHLLASARLSDSVLWTFDAVLRRMAHGLGVAFRSND
jgi:predicted nucleic acid-binding protein